MLVAKSLVPSGDRASGRTWPVSKVVKAACAPVAVIRSASAARRMLAGRAADERADGGSMDPPLVVPAWGLPQQPTWAKPPFPRIQPGTGAERLGGRPSLAHVRQDPGAEVSLLLEAREVERQEREAVLALAPAQLLDHLVRRADECDRVPPQRVRRQAEDVAEAFGELPGAGGRVGRCIREDRGGEADAAGRPARLRLRRPDASQALRGARRRRTSGSRPGWWCRRRR